MSEGEGQFNPEEKKFGKMVVEVGFGHMPSILDEENLLELKDDEYYFGIDRSSGAASLGKTEYLKEKPERAFIGVQDAKKMPFSDSPISKLIYRNVFCDARTEGRGVILSEAARVLENGGSVEILEKISPREAYEFFGVTNIQGGEGNKLLIDSGMIGEYGLKISKFKQ